MKIGWVPRWKLGRNAAWMGVWCLALLCCHHIASSVSLYAMQEADAAEAASETGDSSPEQAGAADAAPDTATDAADTATDADTSMNLSFLREPTWKTLRDQGPFRRPFRMQIKGPIDGTTLRYAQAALRQAQAIEADLIVIEIDSPGGGAVESMEIADMLSQIQWARTVAWIPREATSGGAMIALGCEFIVMQPGATIGDIGVIQLDPNAWAFRYAPAKIRSILVAKARALAERHGRSAELAEAMVDEYAVVYQNRENPQNFKLVSTGAPDELGGPPQPADQRVAEEELPGGWVIVPETRPGRFLTLSPKRAQVLGFSQYENGSYQAFIETLPIEGRWTVREYSFTDRVVDFLNNFWITTLLLIVGIIALFLEIASPGISVGGLVAVLCFSLFFWSHFMGGTAGVLEVILFITGVLCILAEVFLIPGFGIPGIMGIALILLSLVMATLDFVVPSSSGQWTQLSSGLLMVVTAFIVGGVGIGFIVHYMGSIPALNRLTLAPPKFDDDPHHVKKTDSDPNPAVLVVAEGRAAGLKVGDEGVTESVLRPSGRANILGRSVDVVADGKFIEPGTAIKVIDVRGNRLIVVATDKHV